MATTARELLHANPDCVNGDDTLVTVARRLRELDACALPICVDDDVYHGSVTCRSIVYDCVAAGLDPSRTTAADVARGPSDAVQADSTPEEVMIAMVSRGARSVHVVDNGRLVGVLSRADLVTAVPTLATNRPAGSF